MKRLLFFAALLLAVMQATAADVDLTIAKSTAERYLQMSSSGKRLAGPSTTNLKLLYTEVNSTQANKAVYYIFNSDHGFVIVSGDDRAHLILAHGDRPLDLKRMPDNMKFWLGTYKTQIEYLQAHPGLVVNQPAYNKNLTAGKVEPLLTAEWDQDAPYYNHCPTYNGSLCLTGCPATSLSMVFYYWKYPTDPTPPVEGYTNESYSFEVEALPSITFDWDNMLDKYTGNYNTAQADAVAWLMRYVGQEEHMNYTPSGSGAYGSDILRTVKFFGYDESADLLFKTVTDDYGTVIEEYYNDEEWAALLQNEMYEGRPVVYCAYDYDDWSGWSGHAFNVDGYNPTDNTYHVNWGWSGSGNGDFVLNAFSSSGYTFNIEQQMIMGIQPPLQGPGIKVNPSMLNMEGLVGKTATATFTVKGQELTNAITLTLNDESGSFSIDANSVAVNEQEGGKVITVTYAPQASGNHTATITLASPGVDNKTITINGVASLETYTPEMLPANESFINLTQFRADWTDETPGQNVESYTLEVSNRPYVELLATIDASIYSGGYESMTLSAPWSGSNVYVGYGSIYFNNGYYGNGYISYTVPEGYNNEVFTMQITTVTGYYGSGNLTVGSDQTAAVGHQFTYGETYTWYVTASAGEKITITSTDGSYSPEMGMIKVYVGDVNDLNTLKAHEEGDANYRLITGITDKFYTVKDLTAAGTFNYRVMAIYTDGTQSRWSNVQKVTLFENGNVHQPGDVDHDGSVAIGDLSALIDYLLSGNPDACVICADVDGSGDVAIADVSALIDILLAN